MRSPDLHTGVNWVGKGLNTTNARATLCAHVTLTADSRHESGLAVVHRFIGLKWGDQPSRAISLDTLPYEPQSPMCLGVVGAESVLLHELLGCVRHWAIKHADAKRIQSPV